ncbi:tetratricopeptide repeat protein [Methanocella sp. MCL-LM]|uniref:tetratricopeptide repeat protein n=1 Tax=Methanocella sp. MCL-LM TaxID=3412035 RepID=UPI003C73C833
MQGIPRDDVLKHLKAGRSYLAAGQIDKALPELQTAVNLVPDSYNARITLGDLYQKLGKSEEALRAYHKAIKLDPGNLVYQKYLKDAMADRND